MIGNTIIAVAFILFLYVKDRTPEGDAHSLLRNLDKVINPYYTRSN